MACSAPIVTLRRPCRRSWYIQRFGDEMYQAILWDRFTKQTLRRTAPSSHAQVLAAVTRLGDGLPVYCATPDGWRAA